MQKRSFIIIGAGLAGLSAAAELAAAGDSCLLVSAQPSERAQSVLAEGGINASLDTMGEGDSYIRHFEDTMKGGAFLADPNAVEGLVRHAPEIVNMLADEGVPFNLNNNSESISLRNFGGQKKKRTAYARSSTGKMIMTAMIDKVRRYEAAGLVRRLPHHEFLRLVIKNGRCRGAVIRDSYTNMTARLSGCVIMCCGGMNGLFPGMTTGTTANTADAAAELFAQGVRFAGLEMLQYHPTTIGIPGKRCLVSEAARGEGGSLWIMKKTGEPWYFMKEKYPELGDLMPRDVVAREMYFVRRREDTAGEVYLNMTGISAEVWKTRLSDLREEIIKYTGIDPADAPVEVREGIHYFMGGIWTDELHRTSLPGLYAAGECACQYHGANRLGGNSMLGALYGGRVAAVTALSAETEEMPLPEPEFENSGDPLLEECSGEFGEKLCRVLLSGLGIVRSESGLRAALAEADKLEKSRRLSLREKNKLELGRAMLLSALERRESRGAHYREDHPETLEEFAKTIAAEYRDGSTQLTLLDIPARRTGNEDDT